MSENKFLKIGSLPMVVGVLVFFNALYILIVAFGNITDPATNWPFVQHVLSMDTTNFGEGPNPSTAWRAIESEFVHVIAYIGIIAMESLSAVVLLIASFLWIKERGTNYANARAVSNIGLILVAIVFFLGFTVIGGEWFMMWSSEWNGLEPAFQNTVRIMATLILINIPSVYWSREKTK